MVSMSYTSLLLTEFLRPGFWRDILAEFVATFLLIATQLLISIDWSAEGTEPHDESRAVLYAKTTAGYCLAIACLVWAFWEFGGAHMNPAVTFAFALALRMTFHKGKLIDLCIRYIHRTILHLLTYLVPVHYKL